MNNEHAVPQGGNPAAFRPDHLAAPGYDATTRDADPGAYPPDKTASDDRASSGVLRRTVLEAMTGAGPAPPDSAGDRNYLLVLEALSTLPAEQRAVVIETFYNRHGVATAAELLDIPADIVKARCYAALRSLKDALTHRGTLR
jgi:DNA-directed RNA polymerase specialized sigma24 family protein